MDSIRRMGYNPLRRYKRTKFLDVSLLVLTAGAILALAWWAMSG